MKHEEQSPNYKSSTSLVSKKGFNKSPCHCLPSLVSKKGSTNHLVSAYRHWSPKRFQQITQSVLTVIGLQKGFNKSPCQCLPSLVSKKGSTNHPVSAYRHWSPKRVQQITLSVLTVIGLQKGFNKSPSQCLPYLLWLEIMIRLNTVHHLDLIDVVQKSWALLGWQLMARNHAFHWYLWKNNKNHHSLVDHV